MIATPTARRVRDREGFGPMSRDPIGYTDGMNVYQSVHDNPVNNVDPQGLSTEEAK